MKNCIDCTKSIDTDSNFCKYCGVRQVDEAPQAPSIEKPATPTPETDFFIYAGTLKIYKGNADVVTVPQGVTSLGSGVFKDRPNLKQVYLHQGISSISSEAFMGCSSLEIINLPEGLTSIGPKAFQGCSALKTVVIPQSVYKVLDKAFMDCSSLEEIFLHDDITTLNYYAFSGCTNLRKVRLPKKLLIVAEGLLQDCTALKEITMPDGLKSIERLAFSGSGLVSLDVPLTCIAIGEHAFSNMEFLKEMSVSTITKIDNYAFVNTNLISKASLKYIQIT